MHGSQGGAEALPWAALFGAFRPEDEYLICEVHRGGSSYERSGSEPWRDQLRLVKKKALYSI